jgi:hypothetical protein
LHYVLQLERFYFSKQSGSIPKIIYNFFGARQNTAKHFELTFWTSSFNHFHFTRKNVRNSEETVPMPTSRCFFKDNAAARGMDEYDSNEEVTSVPPSSSRIKHEYEHVAPAFANEAATKTEELESHDLDSKPSASAADDSVPSPVKKVSTLTLDIPFALTFSSSLTLFSVHSHRDALKVHLLLPPMEPWDSITHLHTQHIHMDT